MEPADLIEGVDPVLGAEAGASMLAARLVLFPLVALRRVGPLDEPDQRTGRHYVPKPIQKALVFLVLSVANAAFAIAAGKPPVAAISAGAVGALGAMALYDAQHKRGDEA